MGTDIHVYVEVKNDKGNWELANLINNAGERVSAYFGRNYELFGLLAGVRYADPNIIDCIREIGIPDDVTDYVEDTWNELDYHDPVWYDVSLLRKFCGHVDMLSKSRSEDEEFSYGFEDFVSNILYVCEANYVYPYRYGDARVIMFFDS